MKNARISKSWSKHNLPDEIWYQILLRLPVKSLLRFRCVSRSWKIRIDDPVFSRLHLNSFNCRPDPPILFVQGSQSECVVKNCQTLRTISSLGYLQSDLESMHLLRTTPALKGTALRNWFIASSLDGLILLQSKHPIVELMLWNPSIRKTLPLPPFPGEIFPYSYHGLGFDPLIRQYKIVKFVFRQSGRSLAAVYTVGTISWKIIDYSLPCRGWGSSIYFNGVLYGVGRNTTTFTRNLVSFELRREVFSLSELPVIEQPGWKKYSFTIVDDGHSLALVQVGQLSGRMWVLERSGDAVTWTQRYNFPTTFANEQFSNYDFLCMKKNGEMLMKWACKVICYNLETGQRKILMEKNKKKFKMDNAVTYMESLILPS